MSDHELIQFTVGRGTRKRNNSNGDMVNRWAVKKNKEELLEIIAGNTWGMEEEEEKREEIFLS